MTALTNELKCVDWRHQINSLSLVNFLLLLINKFSFICEGQSCRVRIKMDATSQEISFWYVYYSEIIHLPILDTLVPGWSSTLNVEGLPDLADRPDLVIPDVDSCSGNDTVLYTIYWRNCTVTMLSTTLKFLSHPWYLQLCCYKIYRITIFSKWLPAG